MDEGLRLGSTRRSRIYAICGVLIFIVGIVITVEGFKRFGHKSGIFVVGPVLLSGALLCFMKVVITKIAEKRQSGIQGEEDSETDIETECNGNDLEGDVARNSTAILANMQVQFLRMSNGQLVTFISNTSSPDFALVSERALQPLRMDLKQNTPLLPTEALPPYSPRINSIPDTTPNQEESDEVQTSPTNDERRNRIIQGSRQNENLESPPPYSRSDPGLPETPNGDPVTPTYTSVRPVQSFSFIHRGGPDT